MPVIRSAEAPFTLSMEQNNRPINSNTAGLKTLKPAGNTVDVPFRLSVFRVQVATIKASGRCDMTEAFEKWVEEGTKSPYEYGVTTGCKITGDLVSVETVAKRYWNGNALKQAVSDKKEFISGRFGFQGYDGSVSFKKEENGDFRGYLSKEYKDCGNGYYYLLINDEYFIGYDVD